jgi:hypothetical protein
MIDLTFKGWGIDRSDGPLAPLEWANAAVHLAKAVPALHAVP